MATRGALERGHVKLKLIRELATGEHTQSDLAARYGVDQSAISLFRSRHAERIADVAARLDDEFAGLWVAEKAARIATYQEQIEHVADLLTTPPEEDERGAGVNVSTAELMRTQAAALRAIADELGQIPARVQVQHSGSLDVRLNGVDLEALR